MYCSITETIYTIQVTQKKCTVQSPRLGTLSMSPRRIMLSNHWDEVWYSMIFKSTRSVLSNHPDMLCYPSQRGSVLPDHPEKLCYTCYPNAYAIDPKEVYRPITQMRDAIQVTHKKCAIQSPRRGVIQVTQKRCVQSARRVMLSKSPRWYAIHVTQKSCQITHTRYTIHVTQKTYDI